MKDEGFFSPAGKRLIAVGIVVVLLGVGAYALLAEDISIDLDELTETSTTSTTEIEFDPPEIDTPAPLADDPYFRCLDRAETVDEIVACGNQ